MSSLKSAVRQQLFSSRPLGTFCECVYEKVHPCVSAPWWYLAPKQSPPAAMDTGQIHTYAHPMQHIHLTTVFNAQFSCVILSVLPIYIPKWKS